MLDATACPQDISYPTDILYDPALHHKKPFTYRKVDRKDYLKIARLKQTSES